MADRVGKIEANPAPLPSPLTPLVGRERETADVRRRLTSPGTRLLSLIGPGGVGKTRLALHVAAGSVDHFADGVCFVDLTPISDPDLVVSAVAQVLGVREGRRRLLLVSLKEYLRNKQLLLMLDNFEQVLDAGPAVTALLAACPELKFLVTSRAVLRLYGEHSFTVPPLSLPDLSRPEPPDALARYDAVRLFVERAQAAKSDFRLTDATAQPVAEICRRLDGLPLAIELAAARVRLFAPDALLGRLERRLSLLTAGAHDAPAKHRTLRATLAWSYDLLSADEQLLFRRLSVFAGGCMLEAAEAICSVSGEREIDLVSGISGLEEKSLLGVQELLGQPAPVAQDWSRPTHAGIAPPTGVAPRLGMLATVREYASEQLEASGEAEEIRRRHAEHVLALVEEADPKLRGAEQLVWLDRLQADNDNLRAALRWSIERGHGDLALRLSAASWWYWYLRSHLSEGREWLRLVLELPRAAECSAARATALMAAGFLAHFQSDFAASCRWLEQSVALWRELDDRRGLAYAVSHLGHAQWARGQRAEGAALQEAALALFREVGDAWAAGMPLTFLARIALERGDHAQARSALEECAGAYRALGDSWGLAQSLNDLGDVARAQGDYERAGAYYEESLALFRQVGAKIGVASLVHNLGYVAHSRGDESGATALFRECLDLARELGDARGVAESLLGLAGVAAAELAPLRAARLFGAAEAWLASASATIWPSNRADYDRDLATARRQVDDVAFDAAWTEGRAMTPEQSIAFALEAPEHDVPATVPSVPTADAQPPPPLSRREQEVAALVARGLTNRQIADELVIAERTADAHVSNILAKLGFATRAQVAAWVVERGMLTARQG
jgi:predicted ATPase/DNA-binding CsgD family transcriptional regulator